MNIVRDLNCSKCVVCNEMEVIGRRKRRFYRFPRETDKCRAWIRAIGLESLVYMPLAELYEQVVCDAHFPPQCFSARASRLHKVTLPTISQYPSLSDNIMALWPRSAMRVNPPQTCDKTVSDQEKKARKNRWSDDEHVIDFNQPLMTCLGTIKHNERYRVKKPAGYSNTISVPLMTYSSSLEQGTIFAAPEPKSIDFSKLPKLDLQYVDEMSPVEPGNTQTKDFQEAVNVQAQKRDKNRTRRDVVTDKEVFYGLATTICSNKTVQTSITSNRPTKSLNNKQSEIKCKINSIHYLLSKSQFDKSKIIHHYKPIKKSINPKVPKSKLQDVSNTSNMEVLNKSKEPNPIKDEDSLNGLSIIPLESKLSERNTGGYTYTELIIDQSKKTKDHTNVTPESPDTQIGHNNHKDYGLPLSQCLIGTGYKDTHQSKKTKDHTNVTPESPDTQVGHNNHKDYGLPLSQCLIGTGYKDTHQSKRTPITIIDVTIPLMRCTEIVDSIHSTK